MTEKILEIIALLSLGYVLILIELFVPGGILGILGLASVAYGCYIAFDLGTLWGLAAVVLSLLVTALAIRVFIRSRMAKSLVLESDGGADWVGTEEGLAALVGQKGLTLTPLRPAGLALFGEQRIDVVSDSEFLDRDVEVVVSSVEGNRVVVDEPESTPIVE